MKGILLRVFVYTDADLGERGRVRERERKKEKEREEIGQCVSVERAIEGIVFPAGPCLAPAVVLQGSLSSLGKTFQPLSPLNPALGLFILAALPDSFTDVTYSHTGIEGKGDREGETKKDTAREEGRKVGGRVDLPRS